MCHCDLLTQVGFVTVICATCFTVRAVIVAWSALDKQDADLDVWQHPLLDIIYYSLVEIVPSALVLFILRKLVRPLLLLVLLVLTLCCIHALSACSACPLDNLSFLFGHVMPRARWQRPQRRVRLSTGTDESCCLDAAAAPQPPGLQADPQRLTAIAC